MQFQDNPKSRTLGQSQQLQLLLDNLHACQQTPPRKSSFAFGMHKGGSTMLHKFLTIATNLSNIRAISASNILFRAGISDEEYSKNTALLAFFLENRALFMGFRFMPMSILQNKSQFLNFRSIVLIRDPRDCVVSAYFSFLKSHVILADESSASAQSILQERERYRDVGIDEYCLNEMGRFVQEINGYVYYAHENTRIFRYEDIIFRKKKFFESVVDYLGLKVSEVAFDKALAAIDVIPEKETPDAHIRHVTPGDHKLKLKAETIDALTQRYKDTLELCGYL